MQGEETRCGSAVVGLAVAIQYQRCAVDVQCQITDLQIHVIHSGYLQYQGITDIGDDRRLCQYRDDGCLCVCQDRQCVGLLNKQATFISGAYDHAMISDLTAIGIHQ